VNVEDCLLHSLDGVARGHALDVGANVGQWTHMLAAEFASVTAVEADERAYAVLRGRLPGNVVAIHGAACDYHGAATLYQRPSSEQSSLLQAHPIGASDCGSAPVQERAIVNAFTLDDLCPGGADFVKIDIEGAEAVVLSAAPATTWSRATFVVECHDTFAAVSEQLRRLGKSVELVRHPHATAHPGHCWAIGRPGATNESP
jgi:FkbM family methyltransferase